MTFKAVEYKKNLFIRPIPNTSMWEIAFQGGGHMPTYLQGAYTSRNAAMKRIDRYYEEQKRKPKGRPKPKVEETSEAANA